MQEAHSVTEEPLNPLILGLRGLRLSALNLRPVASRRCGDSESERAQSADAEEAGDLGELPAGGGGGPGAGGAGRPLAGGTNRNRAHPAAPEPPAALCQPMGGCEGAGLPVPGAWWV